MKLKLTRDNLISYVGMVRRYISNPYLLAGSAVLILILGVAYAVMNTWV